MEASADREVTSNYRISSILQRRLTLQKGSPAVSRCHLVRTPFWVTGTQASGMQACHRPRCCRVPLLSEVVVIFHRGTGRTVPAESRCVLTLPSPCRSTFRSHPEVIPTRPLPLEAVTRVTQASRCLNTRCVGNATLPQKTRHVSQALTDTCVHWEQKTLCVWAETGLEHFRGVEREGKEGASVLQGRWQLPNLSGAGVPILAGP